MARMMPEELEDFQTPGEGDVYRFLRDTAKPDERFWAWYSPDVNGLEPDFILFSRDLGLVVLEVKDWAIDQILEADPYQVTLNIGGRREARTNPLRQAREYSNAIRESLQRDGRLVSRKPEHFGKCVVPVSFGVVFTNLIKYDFVKAGFDKIVPVDKAFFWDDLHPQSDICSDPTGKRFARTLEEKFPPIFPCRLSGPDTDHLRGLLFPSVRVEVPDRGAASEYAGQFERIRILDHNQEAIARRFDGGHRIITGPSGSGKTLVLVHRAALLLRYNPKVRRILFVCYNITLAGYIRRLLAAKGVPLGPSGVEVLHFFELCSRIVGEEVAYEKEDADYYELVVREAAERAADCGIRYDAVLVDEGQDFSDDMLRAVMGVLDPVSDNLMIALDEGQSIYARKRSWKKLGIEAKGRVHRLPCVYRSTEEIAGLAERFLGKAREKAGSDQHELAPNICGFHGPKPEFLQQPDYAMACTTVAKRARELLDAGHPAAEIAVLYARSRTAAGEDLPRLIISSLEAQGILATWASEDYRAKRDYDVSTQRVTVSTIHSVKGLDYACVFLLGLDLLEAGGLGETRPESLAYVGLTRARYRLVVPFVQGTGLLEGLTGAA